VPDGHVYAFEPSPSTASTLRRNIEANGLYNVTIIEGALGAAPGIVRFNHATTFTAGSRVLTPLDEGGIEVPVQTLDKLAAEHGTRFDFLKIDTEGYEPWVLSGLAGQLRPELPIWMEFNSLCLIACGANPLAFACGLTRVFDAQRIEPDGTFTPMRDGHSFILENMVRRGCVDDLLMRPRPDTALLPLTELIGGQEQSVMMELSAARTELAAVYRSTSWRITAPLRVVGRWLT
jgi:FkbM family methyltransferase